MAEFHGFRCDGCGQVFPSELRTKRTTRFTGQIQGEYSSDLCADCVHDTIPEGIELKPVRRRAARHAAVPTSGSGPTG